MNKNILLGILILLFFSNQSFSASLSDFQTTRFHKINISNGLMHTDAICFAQDTIGFIWIGTRNGLQRFDGKNLSTFLYTESPLELTSANRIFSLCANGRNLWVGAEKGINLFNLSTLTFEPLHFNGTPLNETVHSIYCDASNNLWINSNGRIFIATYNDETKTLFVEPILKAAKNIPSKYLLRNPSKIDGDENGAVWVAEGNNLHRFSTDKQGNIIYVRQLNVRGNNFLGNGNITFYKSSRRLWVLSRDEITILSLTPENGNTIERFTRRAYLENFSIGNLSPKQKENLRYIQLVVDKNGASWITTNMGLLKIDVLNARTGKGTFYTPSLIDPYSISETRLTELFVDRTNTLWIGSFGGGVNFLDLSNKKFFALQYNPYTPEKSLGGDKIKDMDVDKNGNIWIATQQNGVDMFSPSTATITHFKAQQGVNSLSSNTILALRVGPDNNVYIATDAGLDVYNQRSKKFTFYSKNKNYGERMVNRFFCMAFDTIGNLWVGSWGHGLNRISFNNGNIQVKHYMSGNKDSINISNNFINFINCNRNKNEILLSTRDGFDRILLDKKGDIIKIINYKGNAYAKNSINSNYIWPTYIVNDTTYLLGTFSGGLNRVYVSDAVDKNGMGVHYAETFDTENGFSTKSIEGLLYDALGMIWISNNGISRLNPATGELITFDVYDGLHGNSFKVGAATADNNGIFYFGGLNGITFFDPLSIEINPFKPHVAISSINLGTKRIYANDTVNGRVLLEKDISYTDEITLLHNENDFSLSISALQFANPSRCMFRYKLEGYDKEWIEASYKESSASYSNLPYGTYELYVSAANNNGLWSDVERKLTITILPPWWLRKIAFVGYFILLVLLIYVFYNVIKRLTKLKNDFLIQEQVNQMKLQFFTNISHEFRTPLTLILSPLEDLLSGSVPQGNTQRLYQTMHKNTTRLLNLVNELMDFRKAEMGGMRLSVTPIDVVLLINEIASQFEMQAEKNNISFTIEVVSKPENIWGDREKLEKALFNLFSNAFKYTETNGMVTVKIFANNAEYSAPKNMPFHMEKSGLRLNKYMTIVVEDNGIGISKESLPKIFERFYQVNAEISHRHLGSGVGLAMAKNMILLHKGDIGLYSEREKGTTFVINLPVGDSHFITDEIRQLSTKEPTSLSDSVQSHSTNDLEYNENSIDMDLPQSKDALILLVEDDIELQNYLKSKLQTRFTVVTANNGKNALEACKKQLPDVIVTDLMMPIMDGLEMTRQLKDDTFTCHIPVIMLTAKTTLEDNIEGANAGADIYLSKPVDVRLLLARITNLIQNRRKLLKKYSEEVLYDVHELGKQDKDKDFVIKLEKVIMERISDPDFDVLYICDKMNLGRTNLYQKVKTVTDITLGDFIKNVRLKKAVEIMLSKDVSIAEVAYMVGMSSPSYFTKTFKKRFGKTPTEFIEECSR
jgi:signal transduction histidine kinase/CheY-like chemotaxis protein/ligand-binding sensor domain-containing protein